MGCKSSIRWALLGLPASALLGLLLVLGGPQAVLAGGVQRIVHEDGTVEFTNVPRSDTRRDSTRAETVYRYRDETGITSFSNQRPQAADFDVIRFHCFACAPGSTVDWQNTRLFVNRFQSEIETTTRQAGLDPALVRAVIHAESAFNPAAVSPRGAQGLMQLMPATARELGVSDAMDVAQNIRGGVDYLARMLRLHQGDVALATAAYNAGPGAVRRHRGIPPFAETEAYVERVAILHQRYRERLEAMAFVSD
ncbi:MAG: lytic transglycosylase domain-containing protein [Halomonadaceae bacterium]|nr:MAG: lytic transglycosylase domain-containing protein [Halomonadaceae bacterium]